MEKSEYKKRPSCTQILGESDSWVIEIDGTGNEVLNNLFF